MIEIELDLPYEKANWVEKIHNQAQVYQEKYQKNNIYLKALVPKIMANKLKNIAEKLNFSAIILVNFIFFIFIYQNLCCINFWNPFCF